MTDYEIETDIAIKVFYEVGKYVNIVYYAT